MPLLFYVSPGRASEVLAATYLLRPKTFTFRSIVPYFCKISTQCRAVSVMRFENPRGHIVMCFSFFGNLFKHVKKLPNFWNFVKIEVAKFKLNHLG